MRAVEAYNPVANTWTHRASLPAPREWLAAATGGGGLIYAIDGQGAGYHGGKTVVVYDLKTNRWAAAASMHADRTLSTATTGLDGTVYVIAGSGLSGKLRTVEAYTP